MQRRAFFLQEATGFDRQLGQGGHADTKGLSRGYAKVKHCEEGWMGGLEILPHGKRVHRPILL